MDEDNGLVNKKNLNSYEGQTLDEAIKGITLEKGISRVDSIEIIYNELESKYYFLVDDNPPENYLRFFFSLYNIYFWITIIYLGLTFYSIMIMPQVYPYLYLRNACTLLLTLFIPGYLIMDTITPNNLWRETLLKISLGVIISFLLVSISSYMLISSGFVFMEATIMVTLLGITIIISLIYSLNKYLQRNVYNEE